MACWVIFLEQKTGRAGRFLLGAENQQRQFFFLQQNSQICMQIG